MPSDERDSSIPAEVADFFSRIAHDIRAPLSVVSGTLNEFRDDFSDQLTEDHHSLLELSDRGVGRLLRLADRLSTLARLEGNRLELACGDRPLLEVVESAVELSKAVERRRGVDIEIVERDDVRVNVDMNRMQLSVSELVINAIRHASSTVKIGVRRDDSQAEVWVEDDGPGFSEEAQQALWRFARSGTRSSGIGLSLARELTELHGGEARIEAPSEAPQGKAGSSRVVLRLPALSQ